MEGTIGEIRLFAGTFAPKNWALCQGQTMPIIGNQALFSIIGIQYGGDGKNNFYLPDLRGRTMIHPGGPYYTGFAGGEATHQITLAEMPQHTHTAVVQGSTALGSSSNPAGNYLGSTHTSSLPSIYINTTDIQMADAISFDNAGNGVPYDCMQPYLGLNYIICINGLFPSRNQ